MNAIANIRKCDLVALSLYYFPRARANWIFLGVVTSIAAVFNAVDHPVHSTVDAIAIAIVSLLVGIGGLCAGLVCQQLYILTTVNSKSGVLGIHHYSLLPEGLHERTDVNEGLQKWSGIASIRKTKSFLLFRINGHLFHIIPRRSFSSDEAYSEFYETAVTLKRAA